MDKHAPPTDVTYRERRSNEWFDDACHDAKTRARYLERQYQRTRSAADCVIWQDSLKAMHALHNSKRVEATMRGIEGAQGDSKELWRALDRVMGTSTPRFTYVHTADDFADFFANKIAAIRLETASASTPTYAAAPPAVLHSFTDVQYEHVIDMIGSAPCKQSELDPRPTWLLNNNNN